MVKTDEEVNEDNFAGIDHVFVDDLINQLENLIFETCEERFERRGAKGTDEEWE